MIARRAVDIASVDGLTGLSFGRLATDLGISKSGVQALFGDKQSLQLAAVRLWRELFAEEVVRPARAEPPGALRLRAVVEHWINYARRPLLPGGCFRVATLAEFDSHPGQVRDALIECGQQWRALLADELAVAVAHGQIAELDTELAAFQLDAVLCAANTGLRLGEHDVVDKVRHVLDRFLQKM